MARSTWKLSADEGRRRSGAVLPALVHIRGAERLSTLVRLVGDESSEQRSGRERVLTRLVEVLLIEAEYLLAWRMAVAKDLLRRHDFGLEEVA